MSSKNPNQLNMPESCNAMDRFKMLAAREVCVDWKRGCNGRLISRESGLVCG